MAKDVHIFIDISIWELSTHPENNGKWQLAISIAHGGSVTFGPQFRTKKEAEDFLSTIKKRHLFGYAEGFAFMHLLAEKIRLKMK